MKTSRNVYAVMLLLVLYHFPLVTLSQRLIPPREYKQQTDDDDREDDRHLDSGDDELDNATGLHLGAVCDGQCHSRLLHVVCNPSTRICECQKNYPVRLNPYTGCERPNRLGEQCYYRETCQHFDQHSACIQVQHNAICQCEDGYHSVSIQKPSKRVFCAEDLVLMTTDFSTFAGVVSGIAILGGLICFVLRLFNQNMYGTHHHRHRFGNANLAPPILFLSDPGSRRPSIASIHSNTSIRSYSARRYEREREQKEDRELQKRLKQMTERMLLNNNPNSLHLSTSEDINKGATTPSPFSAENFLPTLEEDRQVPPLAIQEESTTSFHEDMPSTSKHFL